MNLEISKQFEEAKLYIILLAPRNFFESRWTCICLHSN